MAVEFVFFLVVKVYLKVDNINQVPLLLGEKKTSEQHAEVGTCLK